MWFSRYFTARFWDARYWSATGGVAVAEEAGVFPHLANISTLMNR